MNGWRCGAYTHTHTIEDYSAMKNHVLPLPSMVGVKAITLSGLHCGNTLGDVRDSTALYHIYVGSKNKMNKQNRSESHGYR